MTNKLRFGFVITNAADRASGPAYSVPRLAQALVELGHHGCVSSVEPRPQAWPFLGVAHHCYPNQGLLQSAYSSPALSSALHSHARSLDILHSHGLWQFPNIYPASAVRETRCKLVISPRGMLAPGALQFRTQKKRLVWELLQGHAVRSADCLHATSTLERDELRDLGLKNPIAVIPNGVDFPPPGESKKGAKKRLLFLSRIHRKKGLDILLQAWMKISQQFEDWELIIAGADFGDLEPIKAMAKSLGAERVEFPGPVYGAEKTNLFRSADLFVLPTRSENFGLVVAEALAHGIPAIVSKGAPWQGLQDNGCGLWIDLNAEALAAALSQLMTLERSSLAAMGERGRYWAARAFSWNAIGQQMASMYSWLCESAPRPNTVDVVEASGSRK